MPLASLFGKLSRLGQVYSQTLKVNTCTNDRLLLYILVSTNNKIYLVFTLENQNQGITCIS